jgi:adenosylcobinamide kinase/adenosylcobinamide-phosphate guanylyltransferase
MRAVLLGTGAADGLPNPFCGCDTCAWSRRHGEVRSQTAVLVEDGSAGGSLLVELPRGVGESASRAGRDLRAVRTVLLSHGDFDHADGAALLQRHWAGCATRVEVLGPPTALDRLRDWLAPTDPVVLTPVAADGRPRPTASGHAVRPLPAAHRDAAGGSGVLWEVRDPDGGALLYAADTGPLPEPTLAAVADAAYDVVLLEETFGLGAPSGAAAGEHLDLISFAAALDRLRAAGAVTGRTDVVAIHLSHHNPPTPDLRRRLAAVGARELPDGSIVGPGTRRDPNAAASSPHRTVLVLGGARSGKSRHAESLLARVPDVDFVATGGQRRDDPEWVTRVAEHQARRPSGWRTLETTDLVPLLRTDGPPLLVDCLALWLTAVLDEAGAWDGWSAATAGAVRSRTDALVSAWADTARTVVGVSNEVGSGVVPATASGRLFRDELGRLNARLAAVSDQAVLVVAGRPLQLP